MPPATITLISVLVGAIRLALGAGVDDEQLATCVDAAKAIVNAPDEEAEQAAFEAAINKLGIKYPLPILKGALPCNSISPLSSRCSAQSLHC